LTEKSTERAVAEAMMTGGPFLVTSHVRPDGDSVGSTAAVFLILHAAGREVRAVFADPVPESFRCVPGADLIGCWSAVEAARDPRPTAAIVLDAPHPGRLGEVSGALGDFSPVINIDHHPGNEWFGDLNLVDDEASSVAELLVRVLGAAPEIAVPEEAAEALLAALYTDTGSFRHGNTTAPAFEAAAWLTTRGAAPAGVARCLYASRRPGWLRLYGEVLGDLSTFAGGKAAWIYVSRDALERHEVSPRDIQEFADIPMSLAGVAVGVTFQEIESRLVKVSFRSDGRADVRKIAALFEGGGHVQAAGAVVSGEPGRAVSAVLEAVERQLASVFRGGSA
jgi:phosphoesterase RecJ-like protein